LLDEPYSSFDWESYQKFWDLVDQRRRAGRTLLVISHFVIDAAGPNRLSELDNRARLAAITVVRLHPHTCVGRDRWRTVQGHRRPPVRADRQRHALVRQDRSREPLGCATLITMS